MNEEAQRIEHEEPEDSQPKSGVWVDSEDFFGDMTEEEIAAGEELGANTPDEDFVEIDGERIPVELVPEEDL